MIDSPLAFPNGAYGHPGMTLRDYFAAAALQGIVAKYGMQVLDFDYPDEPDCDAEMARWAYSIAAEMLIARGE